MKSLYKYCSVNKNDLENDWSLKNLFNNQAKFTTRKNFNDLFDSKIHINRPKKNELKKLYLSLSGKDKREFKGLYLGDKREKIIVKLHNMIEKVFDDYLFYCLAKRPDNNLMWSHYAGSHEGFCIEFDALKLTAHKIIYKKNIPEFNLIDAIKFNFGITPSLGYEEVITTMFNQKLKEWAYEEEYRFHLSNEMKPLIKENFGDFALVAYRSDFIKSIIFGCRMNQESRDFLKNNLPFKTTFKEVIEGKSSITIEDIK